MMRLTQDPVEALWRGKTNVRLTQDTVEVLERFVTNVRLTSMCVEILYQNPDFTPLVPSTKTYQLPLCDSNDAAALSSAPPPMNTSIETAVPMAVRSDEAKVGGS